MNNMIYFDDALPFFCNYIKEQFGEGVLQNNIFLRDAFGVLTLVIIDKSISGSERRAKSQEINRLMPRYTDSNGFAIVIPEEIFSEELYDISCAKKIYLEHHLFKGWVYIHENRVVGADWIQKISKNSFGNKTIVFSSIKGGVGRTTALCVAASHFCKKGYRILAIDLDLEAPGLGNMLLEPDVLPKFGLLDYLVEKNSGDVPQDFFLECVGSSWISDGKGRVDVVPAIGKKSIDYPYNVLGKISRAYMPKNDQEGSSKTFTDSLREFIEHFDGQRYDLIFIDARSGLHETTAAAMLGLDAEVFCFGTEQKQTLAGYSLLFSHISQFVNEKKSWLSKMHFVHAKCSLKENKKFEEEMISLINGSFGINQISTLIDVTQLKETFNVDWVEDESSVNISLDDSEAINSIIRIPDDKNYQDFDPLDNKSLLSDSIYKSTYGNILERLQELCVDDSTAE
ncbi:tyrosine-protein kinase family protein [Cronobacter sakazakii]